MPWTLDLALVGLGLLAQDKPPPSPGTGAPKLAAPVAAQAAEDQRALSAWARLDAAEQHDALAYLTLECSQLGSFQSDLVRYALGLLDQPRASWPLESAPVWYDPSVHAPAQPIPRKLLSEDSADVRAMRKALAAKVPVRRLLSAWRYDYATRSLRRAPTWEEPERVLKNALAGFAPELDLAEALVERALDDGSQQKTLAAFAHAYTDRKGGVFPGLTLFDAWSSGVEIEMPDVDTLGLVHELLGTTTRWTAPVPEQQHEPLYDTLGERFHPAQRHEGLRNALARTFLEGDAVLRAPYPPSLDHLHALWEAEQSTPAKLVARLPKPEAWSEFLATWAQTCHDKPEVYQAGIQRRVTLERDQAAVRKTVLRVLTEFGAFERLDKAPAATPVPR